MKAFVLRLLLSTVLCGAVARAPMAEAQSPGPAQMPAPVLQNRPGTDQPSKNADGTYTIRRKANLVILDVVVTDAKNHIVTDLTQNDFHVNDAGEDEKIASFEAAGEHQVERTQVIESTRDLDRLAPRAPVNIIVLDEYTMQFEDMAFARYSLEKWLKGQSAKLATPTMLLSINLKHLEVLCDYTQSKQQILEALNHHSVANPWFLQSGSWLALRYQLAFQTLQSVADATIGHLGHKNVIWVGRGLPSFAFADVRLDTDRRIDTDLQVAINRLRDARITLYTIDPAGVQVNPSDPSNPFGGNYDFARIAAATGGHALYGRNDVDAEVGTAIRDGGSFYSLSYQPTIDMRKPDRFRRIAVTVDRPGMVVTTRDGYYMEGGPSSGVSQSASAGVTHELLNAGDNRVNYDGLPMSLQATGITDQYVIHIDGEAVTWAPATATNPRLAHLLVVVTQFDRKDKLVSRHVWSMLLSHQRDVPEASNSVLPINAPFKLARAPDAVRARFVVRLTASGRIGTADLSFPAAAPSTR